MAFLDNSGDIILDAVLTDTGRYRLAKGDGSFKITKFALGDDEIDYSLYNKDNASGSAYYDLDILQTPIMEALTDNASALKSHLITISRTDLLFLPVIKLFDQNSPINGKSYNNNGYFIVASDADSESEFRNSNGVANGVFFTALKADSSANNIVVDQGLDTTSVSALQPLSADLNETSYMIVMDNRLGSLYGTTGTAGSPIAASPRNPSYIDDDQMATYLLSLQQEGSNITAIPVTENGTDPSNSSIRGPRGTRMSLKLAASSELQTSNYLFEQLGFLSGSFNVIDTNIRITGVTTGFRIDIPVRYVKLNN